MFVVALIHRNFLGNKDNLSGGSCLTQKRSFGIHFLRGLQTDLQSIISRFQKHSCNLYEAINCVAVTKQVNSIIPTTDLLRNHKDSN